MAKDFSNSLGLAGEEQAVDHLIKQGYRILKRNFRTSAAEIDIIAEKGEIICFIEVKTRKSPDFGLPEEFVDPKKIKKVILGAKLFLQHGEYEDYLKRFDVISVIYKENRFYVDHIMDAFDAS